MKIVVGQKILNLQELFDISTYSAQDVARTAIEVVVDS